MGNVRHFAINADDMARARTFYERLFGWTFEAWGPPGFLMISTGDAATEWNLVMATAILAMLPPIAVVVLMQKWFVKGLVESDK